MALFGRREDVTFKLWQPLRKIAKRVAHVLHLSIGEQDANGTTSRCPVITPHNTPDFILPSQRPYRKPKSSSSLDQAGAGRDSCTSLEQSESPDDPDSSTDTEYRSDDLDEYFRPGYSGWPEARDCQEFNEIQNQRGSVGSGDGESSCPAMDLQHLKSTTCYGFETLHTQPSTLRRESLFHDAISRSVPALDSPRRRNKDSVTDHRGNLRRKSLTMNDLCAASLLPLDPLYAGGDPAVDRRTTSSPSLVRKVFGRVQKICLKHRLSPKSGRRAPPKDSLVGTIEGSICHLVRSGTLSLYDFRCSFSGAWRAFEENGQIRLKFDIRWTGGGGASGGGGAPRRGSVSGLCKQSTEIRRVDRRVEFDAHLGIPDLRSAQLAATMLRIRCCAMTPANRKAKVLGVVYVYLSDLLPNEERHVREVFQSGDDNSKEDHLSVLSPMNAVEVGVTLDAALDSLVITIYCLSKTRRDKLTTGVYVSVCLVQPAASPQNVRTKLQTHNSDQLTVESFTFEVSECLQGMGYICAIITLMNQTDNEVDEVLGRVCLGELAVTEQEIEHWSSALSNPGVTYKRWHTFRTE